MANPSNTNNSGPPGQQRDNTSPTSLPPGASEHLVAVEQGLADQEIVWNRKFFRRGVWAHDAPVTIPWNYPLSDPIGDIETAASLLGHGDTRPVLIIGYGVVDAFRRHPALVRRSLLVGPSVTPETIESILKVKLATAALTFNAGWQEDPQWCVDPNSALLLRAELKEGVSGIIAENCGHSYALWSPSQGVFFHICVR